MTLSSLTAVEPTPVPVKPAKVSDILQVCKQYDNLELDLSLWLFLPPRLSFWPFVYYFTLQEPIIEIESASPLNDSVEDAVVVKVDAQAAEMENLFDDVVSSDPIKQNEFIVDEASSSKEDLEESEVSDTQPNLSALIPPLPTPSPPPQSSSSSSQEDLDAKTAQAIWNGILEELQQIREFCVVQL